MKRVHDAAWPIIGLGAVAVSSWFLFKDLRGLSLASLKSALFSISLGAVAAGDRFDLARLCRARLVRSDRASASAAAASVGDMWRWRRSRPMRSPITSALRCSPGAVVRYRAYSEKGLSVGEIGVLVAFCSFTFALGAAIVGGFCLLLQPELARAFRRRAALARAGRCGGAGRGAEPLRRRRPPALSPAQDRRLRACLSRARRSRRGNCSPGPIELIGASGHHLFRASRGRQPRLRDRARGFCRLVFDRADQPRARGAWRAGIHFLQAMPDVPQANVVAALLVFRLLYLILPLMFALIVVLDYERKRWRSRSSDERS